MELWLCRVSKCLHRMTQGTGIQSKVGSYPNQVLAESN
jgi:hypothetical protein